MSDKQTGYDARFVEPLLKRHECPICLYAMRNPVQTECGHLFCKGCLERVLQGSHPACPVDNTALSEQMVSVFPALIGPPAKYIHRSFQTTRVKEKSYVC